MYTEIEQQTLDIDWFFTNGKYVSFMASGGGKLPESIAKSKEDNLVLASYFRNLPEISEIIINPDLNNILMKVFGSGIDERYIEDYALMTRKGLYSFDKTHPNQFTNPNYHIVASPRNPLRLEDLPENIKDILTRTTYNISLEEIQSIDITQIS
ncbi:hypothetical protein N0B40_11340 [Chryseobacterium oranimense]|uniref:hypothetical protein n=1 Tax=Chryseobacterium oranimense TaxID=421058 RepID=UPI0021AF7BA1|nr:hypothetical protein [Chryseobacterium oranimense]UWX59035.1 hypothetical protein N0B40_11340 [Chryseobacterium oranimense]